MKRSKLMILVMGATIIFFGCEKKRIKLPEPDQPDLKMTSLKCTQANTDIDGLRTPVEMTAEINKWYDCYRRSERPWVTGTTIWVQAVPGCRLLRNSGDICGNAKIFMRSNRGKRWKMGDGPVSVTPTAEGHYYWWLAAEGIGVEGKVKGMEANWTYTMDYIGADFPNPANPTFFYKIEGSIEKNNRGQGKSHKNRH